MRDPDPISLKAREWYIKNEGTLAFEATVLRCLARGAIEKRSDFFLMAERVKYGSGAILWESDEEPNCWFVHWGAQTGPKHMDEFWKAEHKETPLKYIAWNKRGKLKVYTRENWEKGSYGRRR